MYIHRITAVAVLLAVVSAPAAARQRPLTTDDLFRLEEIGDVALSPDGGSIAYVHRRPMAGHAEFQQGFMQGNDRADVWLAGVAGGVPRNLTGGAADGSGFWRPVWSPDGARLAMLSTRGGGVRLWVWHRDSGRLEPWSTRSIASATSFAWIDDTRVAAILLPEGEDPGYMTVERRAATVAMREWPKTWAGNETTVSVIESGVPATLDTRPKMELGILTGQGGPSAAIDAAYSLTDLLVSPDRSRIAVLTQVALFQPGDELLPHGSRNRFRSEDRYELTLADAAGRQVTRAPSGVHVLPASVKWSADGRAIAFVGARDGAGGFDVYRADRGGAGFRVVPLPDLDPRTVEWTAGGALLVSAERQIEEEGKERTRADWWLTADGEPPRNLTETLEAAPAALVPERGGRTFVGVADGDLWRVDPTAGSTTNLTGAFEPKITSIVWPGADVPRAEGFERVIVGVRNQADVDLHRVDLPGADVRPFARPSTEATLTSYRPEAGLAVFVANEPGGTYLTLEHRGARRALVATNEFLAGVAEGALKQIEYRSLEGADLKAWVIHPPGFVEGRRYPVVAWVYAGSMARESGSSPITRLNSSHALNLQLLAARGYVVVMPSMPLTPEGQPSDPYMELPKGVLPALDKLIDMGVADPERLGVIGQSYGGYSTYGLITLTNRFKAAVSLAGLNDLVSLYGVFDMRSRYEPYPHERLFYQSIAESGQVRMGNPPWRDAGRFLRNSPLFYVDRVQTPLLIVQGDMDYVALQQGEQFFSALYRQGKRARFARYWGEGHVFSSPANIRDLWNQIYRWFDEFLAAPPESAGGKRP